MSGTFTLSLDVELLWGVLHWGKESQKENIAHEREAIDALLALLKKYDISATWAFVGHLFLDKCERIHGKAHPDMPRPKYAWLKGDWYAQDPGSDGKRAPEFYGKDILEKVTRASPKQEVGCHGFSHALFGEEGMERNVADAEIEKCVELAQKNGIRLRSMVFPQNSVGHVDVLKKYGFGCYRGKDPLYYATWPKPLRRLVHPLDVALAGAPPAVEAIWENGIWNIPGSMLYLSSDGVRGTIPVGARVAKAKKGIRAAIAENRIFHLWFHPYNLVSKQEEMVQGLEEIFAYASEKRQDGLDILTMGAIAGKMKKIKTAV